MTKYYVRRKSHFCSFLHKRRVRLEIIFAIPVLVYSLGYLKPEVNESWHRSAKFDCKRHWLWVRSLLEKMKYLFKIYISVCWLWSRGKALSSATQHAMSPECGGNWENGVLTLGSICLPCCVRNTTWSWFNFYYLLYSFVKCGYLFFFL